MPFHLGSRADFWAGNMVPLHSIRMSQALAALVVRLRTMWLLMFGIGCCFGCLTAHAWKRQRELEQSEANDPFADLDDFLEAPKRSMTNGRCWFLVTAILDARLDSVSYTFDWGTGTS